MTAHTDFDYDSLPVPDFSSGRRVVLVKSHPTDSPTQEHRWPLINDAINAVLAEDHPAAFEQICELVDDIVASHRGWRTPAPSASTLSVTSPTSPATSKTTSPKNKI